MSRKNRAIEPNLSAYDDDLEEHMALAIAMGSECQGASRGQDGVVSLWIRQSPPPGAFTRAMVRPAAVAAAREKYKL